MNESVTEHRIIGLHKKILAVLGAASIRKPASMESLRKIAGKTIGGEAILDQFLNQLLATKAISHSTGMLDGERFINYWPADGFNSFINHVSAAETPRPFTAADKSLIRRCHGFMTAQQMLDVLNERLANDLGPDAVPYTMEQLYSETGGAGSTPAGGHDYPSLRKLLAKAERDGVLAAIDEQTIDDFAVVFSLNSKQVMILKDIVLQAKEEE